MSDETDVERLLENFQAALNTLNGIGDVEGLLGKLDAKNDRKLLKKVKTLVGDVHNKVNAIREKVSKTYKRVKTRSSSEGEDREVSDKEDSVAKNKPSNSGDNSETSEGGDNVDNNKSIDEIVENTPEKVPRLKLALSFNKSKNDVQTNKNIEAMESSSDEDKGGKEDTKKGEEEKKDESEINSDSESNETLKKKGPPIIKLVDINKLLAPNAKPMELAPTPTKGRKSVTFDSSVIVLTSSDEDTPKRNPKGPGSNALKSVLRKSSSKAIVLSDSDSKENNENLKNTKKMHKKIQKPNRELSSDDSDDDVNYRTRMLRRKDQTTKKDNFSRLLRERKAKQDKKRYDEHSPNRKSKRNHDGEVSDSEEDDHKANPRKRKKKELPEESSLSDNSDSDAHNKKTKKKFKSSLDINDHKLKARVYVRLPKYETEQLVELYKKKKEKEKIEDSKNPSKVNSNPLSSKPDKSLKLTLRLNNKGQQKKVYSEEEQEDDANKLNTNQEEEVASIAVENGSLQDIVTPAVQEQTSDKEEEEAKKSLEENEPEPTNESSPTTSDKEELNKPKCNGSLSNEEEEKDEEEEETDQNNQRQNEREKDIETINCEDTDKEEQDKPQEGDSSDSSDSDDFSKVSKKKDNPKSEPKKKKKIIISDSEPEEKEEDDKDSEDDRGNDSLSEKEDNKKEKEPKPTRKRIKRVKDSSSDEEDKSTRKQIRKMIDRDSLSETTKKAEADEKARKARIIEKQKKYNQIFDAKADATVDKVVLDFDEKTDKPLLSVHKDLVKQLKPHQVQGVKFMWDACFESLDRTQKSAGSGCILAHCMGLGKTLQVITLSHTLLTNQEKTKVNKILVVCPVNTVLNWRNEFKKWMPSEDDIDVYELVSCKTTSVNHERSHIVKCWHEGGGVLIIGYTMFRTLSNPDNKTISKKLKQSFKKGLVDPGPDMVVCDEGHLLKNEKTNLSIAMNRIKTARRIVLTGTPLQNNLREYWCMVQFIKPNLLGTYKEYLNRFVNPITNGQYTDSTQHDIMVMRRRSHVLHKLLDGVVQRQDYAVLEPYLPPKYEYVLFLKLTDIQIKLYKHYISNFARRQSDGSNRTSFLFTDFQELQRICTHPRVLLDKSIEDKEKKEKEDDSSESEGSMKDFLDDGSEEASSTSSSEEGSNSDRSRKGSGSDTSIRSNEKKKKKKATSKRTRLTRAQAAQKRENGILSDSEDDQQETSPPKEWWEEYINKDALDNINDSSKMFLLFQILKECEEIGDKILVFSQSLYTLNCIEYFLWKIDEATQKGETDRVGGYTGSWSPGLDYFRLDGSSSCDNRASWCDHFNDPENTRARLFLISTKAGGLGINLVAANRVIIFDVSWNPSHDIQSIYRVYRFGQTKPSYIYRFVTYGAMEMKIYERQVTKQAISKRVIDEQQIDRHYSQNDIQELYKIDLELTDRPIPMVPKDVLLGELLQKHEQTIYKYHEHQSLLENKQDEELNEDERKAAWEEFENEKVLRKTTVTNFGGIHLGAIHNNAFNFSPQLIQMALANIVRKDNPAWSEVQIKGILPALVTQLQVQMSENDFSMYNRVQQEIRMMQALQAQRIRENFLKQYQLQQQQQMLQKQQQINQLLGNMNITPEEIRLLQMAQAGRSSDVIELND